MMAKSRRPLPRQLVLATNNSHKVKEIKAILKKAGLRLAVLTLNDFPKSRPIVENKWTIEGNALKKAKEMAKNTGCLALADDTGLFIRALNSRPGVYSARFAGPGCTYQDNNQKVLRLMRDVPPSQRQATFRCVAALATPMGKAVLAQGRIRGRIVEVQQGTKGFGYDSIFLIPKLKKTFAQLSSAVKNRISHRGRAFSQIPTLLKRLYISVDPSRKRA